MKTFTRLSVMTAMATGLLLSLNSCEKMEERKKMEAEKSSEKTVTKTIEKSDDRPLDRPSDRPVPAK